MEQKLKDLRILKKQFKKAVFSSKISTEEIRKNYEDIFYSPHTPNNVDIEEIELKNIKTDILKPEMAVSGRTILYAHGGSFISGSKKAYRNFCATIANISSANLYLPEYRLAPEYPFPTALEDLYSVYAKLIDQEKITPQNLIIIGDGAGAGLIISLIHYLQNRNLPLPAMLILISPWVDLSCSNENLSLNRKKDFILSKDSLFNSAKLYTYENNLENTLVSPIFGSFKKFPEVFIQCGENEILLSDSKELISKLEEENCSCELCVYDKMPHLFQALPDYFAEAHIAVEKIGEKIRTFFNQENNENE